MTLSRWTIAHNNSTASLSPYHTIITALILLVLIIDILIVVSLLRRCPPMLLIILGIVHGLFRNGIIIVTSIVLPWGDWWVRTVLLILTLQVLRILLREGICMLATIVASHLCLARGTCIGHWDVVGTWTGITNRTILWGVLRASISIRRAASSASCKVRWHVSPCLLSSVAVVLWIVGRVLWCNLLLLSLLSSFLESSFETVFHSLSISAWNLNSSNIYLRSLLP
jgi:hypothetical protein